MNTQRERSTRSNAAKIPADIREAVQKSLEEKRVQILESPPSEPNPVVYTTVTGQEPRGGPSLTDEATELPPPEKVVRKKTTKKHKPRVKAKAEPLHKNIKVRPDVWAVAQEHCRKGEHLVIVDETTVITEYDSGLVARIVS